ncbi:uncharacterized protein PV06_11609 [Exophiala oligosperma]|uniref:Phenazine biosynthesis protein PhzF family n=1 Tax=Exophiala oligosperma TaxID=215243 RepID=A0A0D2A702_9EURO|nr:uncharacterized protein PV06_11609 [Exophiala oligosperma]KIW36096.1 hypothetical protein PV06_11609 [Exophiala oligosperma]
MSTQLSFVTLDVFTPTRYRGNPLAIIKVPSIVALTQDQKQEIAREFNLSESVFLHEQTAKDRADHSVRIDIFTSYAEVPFAGHPTVGTANYILRQLKNDSLDDIQALQTKAGRLPWTINPSVGGVQISVAHNLHIHGSPFADQPFGHFPVVSIVKGMTFILVHLPDLDVLAAQTQNLVGRDNTSTATAKLDHGWREGIVVTYFYVNLGVTDGGINYLRVRSLGSREDPATGSAASALTSYVSLQTGKAGRYRYKLTQGVEMGQKSEIFVEIGVKESSTGQIQEIDDILLSGCGVQTMQGTLEIPISE